jgi:hypothetical protein
LVFDETWVRACFNVLRIEHASPFRDDDAHRAEASWTHLHTARTSPLSNA